MNIKNKYLYLIRGLPGSGKTSLAKSLNVDVHFEADMYFTNIEGEYKFDSSKIKNAHNWCKNMVEQNMLHQTRTIAISNTFTQEWEMQPYYDLAKKYGYQIFSLICENRHEGVNIHDVPDEALKRMKNRFEVIL